MQQANGRRVWVNAELGIRHYLEDRGALPLLRDQVLRPNDIVVSSELVRPVTVTAPTARLMEAIISPSIPLRLISIEGGSGYSASSKGQRPFETSSEIVDRLTADVVTERKAELSFLDPQDPKAAPQLVSGLYPDGWMAGEASVLLKVPPAAKSLRVEFFIPDNAPARRMTLLIDGRIAGEDTYSKPGSHSLEGLLKLDGDQKTVVLRVDKTHGVVITGVGFR
jgi:hypothetical protein